MNVIVWMAGDRHGPRLAQVNELTMTAAGPVDLPAVFSQQFKQRSNFQSGFSISPFFPHQSIDVVVDEKPASVHSLPLATVGLASFLTTDNRQPATENCFYKSSRAKYSRCLSPVW
jgi:hypothetical protein